MSSEWRETRLQDIVSVLGDGLHGTPNYTDDGDYYFINGNNLDNGRIVFTENTKRVSHDEFVKYKKNLNNRTLLVSINGTLGNIAYYNQENVILGKSACYFNLLDDIDKKFIRYILSSNLFLDYIGLYATGTTIKNVSLKSMREFSFKLPPLPEQRAIAHILGTLDDKIENNRRMNATLEGMAQALFKSWFVDFDPVRAKAEGREPEGMDAATAALFPDRLVDSELGEVPEGWGVGTIRDVTKSIFSGGTPSTREQEYWDGDICWLSSGETREKFITSTEKKITLQGVNNSSTRLALPGDIVIASAGQGHTRGQTSYLAIESYINQSVVSVRADQTLVYPAWLFYNLASRYEEMRGISDGHSIRGSLTTKLVGSLSTCIPNKSIIDAFSSVVSLNIELQIKNRVQIYTLSSLRDTLLPKLISGELRVPEAEELAGEIL